MQPRLYKLLFAVSLIATYCTLHAQSPTLQWVGQIGSSGGDWGSSLAIDPAGNVISTGQFIGLVDFDPGPGTSNLGNVNNTQDDVYVQKLTNSGQLIWARTFGSGNADVSYGIETDDAGAVYVVGAFSATCDFDPGPAMHNVTAVAGGDIYILKLDAQGNFVWVRTFSSGGGSGDVGISIARSTQNRMVISGTLYGNCDFDPGPGVSMVTYNDSLNENIFIVCLDTAGQYVWAAGLGDIGWDEPYELKCDPMGNIYLTGMFTGTADFDPGPGVVQLVSQSTYQNIFVIKLDANGNLVYANSFPGTSFGCGLGTACTPSGEGIFAGTFWGTADFDPGPGITNITAVGMADIFILKLDATGNLLWVKTLGTAGNEVPRALTTDQAGNIYCTGDFSGTMDFDPGTGVHNMTSVTAGVDIFIEKFDSAGNYIWATGVGSPPSDYCFSVKTDVYNSVFTTGRFSGAADFDPSAGSHVLTANQTDAFVQKYVQCSNDTFFFSDTACTSYTLNNQTYTTSGTYTQLLSNINGCDSVLVLDLTINNVDVGVSVNDPTITANASGATYQWINCENGFPIAGATAQSFTPALNGTYAVVVSQNTCSDTSVCNVIVSLDASELNSTSSLLISENPNSGRFLLTTSTEAFVTITDVQGKNVGSFTIQPNTPLALSLENSGMYLITSTFSTGEVVTRRIVVSR